MNDFRFFGPIFEVHYWPEIGRVLTVHCSSATGNEPLTMEVTVTGVHGSADLNTNTMIVAWAFADAADPKADVVYLHGANGETMSMDMASKSVTSVYPPINPVRVHS